MPYIKTIQPAEATGKLKEVYSASGGPSAARGKVAMVRQVQSLHPDALAAWSDLGRSGKPKLWGQGYFALGDAAKGEAYLRDYYAFTGGFVDRIAAGQLTSSSAIRDYVRGYEEAGCDELVLFPTVADIDDLERLQEAIA